MIRSKSWDMMWILSGPLLGLALIPVSMFVRPQLIVAAIVGVIGMAHRISPMVLAACHPEARARVLADPRRFLVLPIGLLLLCAAIGWFAPSHRSYAVAFDVPSVRFGWGDFKSPVFLLSASYVVWNAWHFGMQNFGVLSIYRAKTNTGIRWVDKHLCLIAIAVATALPILFSFYAPRLWFTTLQWCVAAAGVVGTAVFLCIDRRFSPRVLFFGAVMLGPVMMMWWATWLAMLRTPKMFMAHPAWRWLFHIRGWPLLWGFALITLNHYLVAIGISSHAWSRRQRKSPLWFVTILLLAGAIISITMFINPLTWAFHASGFSIGLLIGISFVHFLYDGWLYKFSDPAVRATIGKDLFAHA